MISKHTILGSGIFLSRRSPLQQLRVAGLSMALSLFATAARLASGAEGPAADFVIVPGPSNAVQLRLQINASAEAPRLFNTFEIEAYGETVLRSPDGDSLKRSHGVRTGGAS